LGFELVNVSLGKKFGWRDIFPTNRLPITIAAQESIQVNANAENA